MPSAVHPEPTPSSQRPIGPGLPQHEALAFSLTPAAQRALAQLTRTHPLKKLEDSLVTAQKQLTEAAGDINDRLVQRTRLVKSIHDGGINLSEDGGEADSEQNLMQMRNKVQNMTQRMDDSLRKLIDGQCNLRFLLDSIQTAGNETWTDASTQASTHRTRSQHIGGSNGDTSYDEEAEDEFPEFTPTDPANISTQRRPPPIDIFRASLDAATTRYQSYSLVARYGESNEYRDFKRVVHDALYPDDEVRLPHHSEWFQEGTVPAPGVRLPGAYSLDEDEDEDIAVSRATTSTKCPITLQELKEPLTSKKCPHSFESSAILTMIQSSSARLPAPSNHRAQTERAVQCPVPGCDQMLSKSDLHVDAVFMRKIKRMQHARQIQQDDDDDDNGNDHTVTGTQGRMRTLDDDDEEMED